MKNQVNVVKIIRTYKKYANGILQNGGFTMIANEEASPVHVPLSLEACTRRVSKEYPVDRYISIY